jgi:hypothetical protein
VDRVEGDTRIFPPIAFAPVSAVAGPFQPSGAYSCHIASASDGLVHLPNECLNGREFSFALHSGAPSDHPLRLVEYFNRLNLILQAIVANKVKERDEPIVEVGVRFPRILHHPQAVVKVHALEAKHGQHDLEARAFRYREHGFNICEELVGKGLEVPVLIEEGKLLVRIIMNPDSHCVGSCCLIPGKGLIEDVPVEGDPEIVAAVVPGHVEAIDPPMDSRHSSHDQQSYKCASH